ncbi:PilZ domain-containing protein [Neobacillus kokaensis]|uniref:PilZ domain-containing protein n=1 Tax=Neobacillus kokaensis TaxID=2759023 RepID=A0ABQ3N8S0_9BACI|nr:PilZ domain-containing protein [Neobacillus kokaensis]GHH99993.1 hypothetical protein AM1BK_35360 [Neobacillus kokaensis]
MGEYQIILATAALFIFVSFIIFSIQQQRIKKHRNLKKAEKQVNRRDSFRLRIDQKNSIMEVLRIGNLDVNEFDDCEISDVSAGGAGIISYYDFPLKQKVYVKLHFHLNNESFSLNGRIVRKVERINKSNYFYGLQFLDLSVKEEERLMKEIVALENRRRQTSIK